jgi:hypothetical protein
VGSPHHRQETADIIGAGDDELAPRSGLAAARRRWLPIGLAFTVGVLVGAAGWDRWRDFSDERARRSAVALAADLSVVSGHATNEGDPTISVVAQLGNSGPLPVDVLSVGLDPPGLVKQPGAAVSTVTLEPGMTRSVQFVRSIRCEELAVADDEPLVVRVRTADGHVRERRLVLTDDVLRIAELAKAQC